MPTVWCCMLLSLIKPLHAHHTHPGSAVAMNLAFQVRQVEEDTQRDILSKGRGHSMG